ncbi:hypothetical protein Tco_0813921 [Tanacetum coccineum]
MSSQSSLLPQVKELNESEHSEDSQLNFDEEEKKDNDGDADDEDEDDDHTTDIQDTDDEDAKTESDEDEIYKNSTVISETITLPPILEIPTETSVSTALSPPHVTPTISIVQQTTTPIPTPSITTKAPTITTVVPEFDALTAIQLRVAKLEKDVSELKKIDHYAESLASLKS